MISKRSLTAAAAMLLAFSVQSVWAQADKAKLPDAPAAVTIKSSIKVTQIDIIGLKKLLKPNGRPLLVNFWATWCPPCTEEFPDLVNMDKEYRGKVDFVTVSLDDLADISTYVPKFLEDMKSEMPAYLLHTANEEAAIALVSPNSRGVLPMTVLYDAAGKQSYLKMGKIRPEILRENIRKLLPGEEPKPAAPVPAD